MNEVDTRASGSCCGSGRGLTERRREKVEELGNQEEETGEGMGLI